MRCMSTCGALLELLTRTAVRRSSHVTTYLPLARWTVAHICCREHSVPVCRLDRGGLTRNEVQNVRKARLWSSHTSEAITVDQRRHCDTTKKVAAHAFLYEFRRRATAAISSKMA